MGWFFDDDPIIDVKEETCAPLDTLERMIWDALPGDSGPPPKTFTVTDSRTGNQRTVSAGSRAEAVEKALKR